MISAFGADAAGPSGMALADPMNRLARNAAATSVFICCLLS
jgi:hypothetical protein